MIDLRFLSLVKRDADAGGEGAKGKPRLKENERRLVLIAVTVSVLIVAALTVLASGGGTPLSRCNGIVLSAQRASCLVSLAQSTQNVSVCKYVPAGYDQKGCISTVAQAKDDPSLCSLVNDSASIYSTCIENITLSTRDASYCALLPASNVSKCAYGVAESMHFESQDSCSYITNASMKAECDYEYYYNEAVSTKSGALCADLPDSQNSSVLTSLISQNASATSLALAYGSYNLTPQGYCYYRTALSAKNTSICLNVVGVVQGLCIASINSTAVTGPINYTQLEAECNQLNSTIRSFCTDGVLSSEAVSEKNASICLETSTPQYQDSCITALATQYGSSSYCSYISNSTEQQYCYYSATHLNQSS